MQNSSDNSILLSSLATAVPLLVTLSMSSLIGLSDMYMASLVGNAAQAAVGIADQVLFLTVITATGLCGGVGCCVAQSFGGKNMALVRAFARDSLVVAFAFGLIAWLAGAFFAPQIFYVFGADERIIALGVPYLRLCAFGNLPWSIAQCQTSILRASGAAHLSIIQWAVISVVSIGASAIFFLYPGLPGYHSLETLALTWDAGCIVGVLVGWFCLKRMCFLSPNKDFVKTVDQPWPLRIRRLMRIGIPLMLTEVCYVASNFLLYRLASSMPQGADVQAAWAIKSKVEDALASTPLLAMSLAAATLIGQSLGAKDVAHARKLGWKLTATGVISMIGLGVGIFLGAPWLACRFSNVTAVADIVEWLLRGSLILLPLNAVSLILFGGMEGAGFTRLPMAVNAVAYLLVRLPLAWLLALPLGLGIKGIWLATFVAWLFMCLAACLIFARRSWEPRSNETSYLDLRVQ